MTKTIKISDLKSIEEDSSALYKKIVGIIKEEYSNTDEIFKHYLSYDDDDIKAISLKGLLFYNKSKESKIIDLAIKYASSNDTDEDLRKAAFLCLGEVYYGTKDKEVLEILFSAFSNEDEYLSLGAFTDMLSVYGVNSVNVFKRNGKMIIDEKDLNLQEFQKELDDIKKIIESQPQ